MNVLILGGYGMFGSRLTEVLSGDDRLRLIIAGRSLEKATAACARPAGAKLVPAAIDRDGDLAAAFELHRPYLVVDASGPFQAYGKAPYRVIEAALDAGADYLDLADGADFIDGVAAFDARARAGGRFALSGVSTVPALSMAVAKVLADGMARVERYDGGIAPAPSVGFGRSILEAVFSYAGKPLGPAGRALVTSREHTVMLAGEVPLGPMRFVLVDVPDLAVARRVFAGLEDAWFGVAVRPRILARILAGLAWLRGMGVLPCLRPLAGLAQLIIGTMKRGDTRGAMFMALDGFDAAAQRVRREWHLLAPGDSGPFIPTMAAAIIIRSVLAGERPAPGARSADGSVRLEQFDDLFSSRGIFTAIIEPTPDGPLYRRILGPAYGWLDPPLQALHEVSSQHRFTGLADVTRPANPLARVVGALFGFPAAGSDIPVTVVLSVIEGKELWQRTFAGTSFHSTQELGRGRYEGLVVERFGPFAFGLAIMVREGELHLVLRKWGFFGLPLPVALAPANQAFEDGRDGLFRFNVRISLPLVGLLVWYRGWLKPEASAARSHS